MTQTELAADARAIHQDRRRRLAEAASLSGAGVVVISEPTDLQYLTGYRTNLYSRPIRLVIAADRAVLTVPDIELVQAEESAQVDDILAYSEVPDRHPVQPAELLARALTTVVESSRRGSTVGIDATTCTVQLRDQLVDHGYTTVDVGESLRRMRLTKDASEVAAIRRAASVVTLGVEESLGHIRTGLSEIELDGVGDAAMREHATQAWPDGVLTSWVMSPSGPRRTMRPHTESTGRVLGDGDVVIHSRQVVLDGYRAEFERTVVLGDIDARQQRALDTATLAQRQALDTVAPGVAAADVNAAAAQVFSDAGFTDAVVHRTGHGVGLSFHEGPSVDFLNRTALEVGMCLTVEPGLYAEGLGGFRHSDTVLVTAHGCEILTGTPEGGAR